jgi:hypothetical protein
MRRYSARGRRSTAPQRYPSNDAPDFGHLERIVTAARGELEAVGITRPPGAILADSGYWHVEQMHRLAADGIPGLIPSDSGLRTKPRPGWDGGYYAFMRHVLSAEFGTSR